MSYCGRNGFVSHFFHRALLFGDGFGHRALVSNGDY